MEQTRTTRWPQLFVGMRGIGSADALREAAAGITLAAGVENRAGTARTDARTDRRGDLANNRPDRVENRTQRSENRGQRRDEIRNQVRDNHPWAGF